MVSIIICTFNRATILHYCLDSIEKYGLEYKDKIEIVIVDNNCTDNTRSVIDPYIKRGGLNFRYIPEEMQGLSVARNTGALNAKYDWLFYLDDDAILRESTLDVLFRVINEDHFDFFGGIYNALYIQEKPRWLPDSYGTNKVNYKRLPLKADRISGGIMVIQKKLLFSLGMFNIQLGMSGSKLGFAEESDLQNRYLAEGGKTTVYPDLQVDHIVGRHKFSVWWHLKQAFVAGRDDVHKVKVNFLREFFILLPVFTFKNLWKLLKPNYFWQNFIIDSLNSFLFALGSYSSKISRMFGV